MQHKETAEDIVQEVFYAAYLNFNRFEYKSNPKTWLISILKNKIADYYIKHFNTKDQSAQNDTSIFFSSDGEWQNNAIPQSWTEEDINLLDDPDFLFMLDKCMKELPSNWFITINYKYLEEKESSVICQELGISDTNY